MGRCISLEKFPPIVQMIKLETLRLFNCEQLQKFPEIQGNMDSLVELDLSLSRIEILPSSIGEYCINLVSLNLNRCNHLKRIEVNFLLLKHLKELYLDGCAEFIPKEGFFDVEESCLQLFSSSFMSLHQGIKSRNFRFSPSLTTLKLGRCKLKVLYENLSNLEVLDLSSNDFSRLGSTLSQLPRLKYLDLSYCQRLVELPDLPSSMAILIAKGCDSLKVVESFLTNLKWLWKLLLPGNALISGDTKERVLQLMLQGNAIENHFISICFGGSSISTGNIARKIFMLELPWNWYNEFTGFLVHIQFHTYYSDVDIIIKDVIGSKREDVYDIIPNTHEKACLCYISFGALRHTKWWNSSTHIKTSISFSLQAGGLGGSNLKVVELVPRRRRRSKGDTIERETLIHTSQYWDQEDKDQKTFEIVHDSNSSIQIQWHHHTLYPSIYNPLI